MIVAAMIAARHRRCRVGIGIIMLTMMMPTMMIARSDRGGYAACLDEMLK